MSLPVQARTHFALALALLAAVALVYGQTAAHGFLDWDDDGYTFANHRVREGLNWANLLWAFSSVSMSNWHPLTWLSHMTDVSLFGLWPGGHHLVNVGWHGANSVLLYFALCRLGGDTPRAALVALLFALHPLHVESVAWISERKDLLCAFFWMLALIVYADYARTPTLRRYLALFACLAAALMAKPMAVSLPLVLLALDFWPLGRHRLVPVPRLILEKVPLATLALGSASMTLFAQFGGGSARTLEQIGALDRLQNVVVAYATYVVKTVLPTNLSFFQVFRPPGATILAGSLLLLTALAAAAIVWRRRAPWVAVGLFWFAVALLPVVGIVRVGDQAWASRYTYLPHVGLFLALVWSLPVPAGLPQQAWDWARAGPWAALIVAAGVVSALEVRHWKSPETLYRRAIEVDPANYVAHVQFARYLVEARRYGEALAAAAQAVRHAPATSPTAAKALVARSRVYLDTGDLLRAEQALDAAAAIDPGLAVIHYNRGTLELMRNNNEQALPHLERAIRLDPMYSEAYNNLGAALGRLDRLEAALAAHRAAATANPDNADALYNVGATLERLGQPRPAEDAFTEAAQRAPRHVRARLRAARLAAARGDAAAARRWAVEALALEPGNAEAHRLATVDTRDR